MKSNDIAMYIGLMVFVIGIVLAGYRYLKSDNPGNEAIFRLPFGIEITLKDNILAIVVLGMVLFIIGLLAPRGGGEIIKPEAMIDCSNNRNLQIFVNLYNVQGRSSDKLRDRLAAACFKVKTGPFPYTAHVDPDDAGTTYIIPSNQLAAKGTVMDSVEDTIVSIAKTTEKYTKMIQPGEKGPGIFRGGKGPVATDVVVYLF